MPLNLPSIQAVWANTGFRVGQFLSWWRAELREAWEDWSLYRSAGADGRGRVEVLDGAAVLTRLLAHGPQELGRVPLEAPSRLPQALAQLLQGRRRLPADLDVVLPQAAVLCREANLPEAVGRRLSQTVAYQIERLMPLRADLIYHHCALLEHDLAHRRLRVAVTAARRALVDEVTKAVLEAGARRVSVLEPSHGGRLLRRSRVEKQSFEAVLTRRLAAGAGALALLLAALLGWQYRAENRRLAAQVELLRHSAAGAEKLRDELDDRLRRMHLLAERLGAPAESQVFAELTRLVPENAWLFQFQVENGQIDIAGFSPDASALTATLAKSTLFHGASLRSAVKSQGTEAERFDITMRLPDAAP